MSREYEYLLEMKNIVKVYPGVRALGDANLRIKEGEVHGLVGENGAGKSTLMKILLGAEHPDGGEVIFKGEKVNFKNPADASEAGICMIPQEISLVDTTDLSENIWIGREKKFAKFGFINRKERIRKTQELFGQMEVDLKASALAGTLSSAQKQLLMLAKCISFNASLVIMDEPTSSLSEAEVQVLYKMVRNLVENGASVIFIGHKLEEIFEICDRITVLRDGSYVSEHEVKDVTNDMLVEKIAGRKIENLYPPKDRTPGEVVLQVKNFSSGNAFRDVSFEVRAGEILGLYGLVGAGRSEVMRAVYGADKHDSGEVYIEGKKVNIQNPRHALENGMAMVTEDRLQTGIIADQTVRENASVAYLPQICSRFKFLDKKQELKDVEEITKALQVKYASLAQTMSSLSGGNQQKVIVAKWLLTKPKILILDEPTRGIDVGSKSEIHKLIASLAKDGMAVVMISSEMPEVMGMSDRILVMRTGRVSGEFTSDEMSAEAMTKVAFGIQ